MARVEKFDQSAPAYVRKTYKWRGRWYNPGVLVPDDMPWRKRRQLVEDGKATHDPARIRRMPVYPTEQTLRPGQASEMIEAAIASVELEVRRVGPAIEAAIAAGEIAVTHDGDVVTAITAITTAKADLIGTIRQHADALASIDNAF